MQSRHHLYFIQATSVWALLTVTSISLTTKACGAWHVRLGRRRRLLGSFSGGISAFMSISHKGSYEM